MEEIDTLASGAGAALNGTLGQGLLGTVDGLAPAEELSNGSGDGSDIQKLYDRLVKKIEVKKKEGGVPIRQTIEETPAGSGGIWGFAPDDAGVVSYAGIIRGKYAAK